MCSLFIWKEIPRQCCFMQPEKRAQPTAVQLLDDFSFYKKEVISSSLLKDASPYLFPLAQHKGEFEFMKPKVAIKGLT